MAANPLIANYLASQAAPPPGLGAQIAMPSTAPALSAPIMPTAVSNPMLGTQTDKDTAVRDHLLSSGAGVDQVRNPLLRGISKVGDIAASVFAPRLAQFIPGTTLHHQLLVNQATSNLNEDQKADEATAQTAGQNAVTSYETQKPVLEQNKIDATAQKNKDLVTAALAKNGQVPTWDASGVLTTQDDPNSQAYKNRVALEDMHKATADKDQINAEIAQNKYQPGTHEYDDAQRRLNQVDSRLHVAMAGLGLRAQSLDLRRQNTDAALYGTDEQGAPLPGAAQITDGQGNTTTVGSKNAGHAISQQKTVGSFNDLSGSVTNARSALQALAAEGGSLSDPQVVAAMSDPTSTIGKVINGKLVQGNLTPTQIKAVNAVRQLHEQAGILRSTTGGTSSEAGAQRILDVVPGAGDANAVALQKLDEQEKVLGRLSVGQTHVAGGLAVKNSGKQSDPLGIR